MASSSNLDERNVAFQSKGLQIADQLVAHLRSIDDKHNLAPLLWETVMSVREVLSCWMAEGGELPEVATMSLLDRSRTIEGFLSDTAAKAKVHVQSYLERSVVAGFQQCLLKARLNTLYHLKVNGSSQGDSKPMDLRELLEVKQINTGSSAQFELHFAQRGESNKTRTFLYRAFSDQDRQKWLNYLGLHSQTNQTNEKLNQMPIGKRAELYIQRVFVSSNNNQSKETQFLFSTTSDEDNHMALGFAHVERFPVIWKKMGQNKEREIELDLNPPRRIIFYKDQGASCELAFPYRDFLDYRIRDLEVEICCKNPANGKFRRRFNFASDSSIQRFSELVQLFQKPPGARRFIYEDLIRVLRHVGTNPRRALALNRSTAPGLGEDSVVMDENGQAIEYNQPVGIFSLHKLLELLAEICPQSTRCVSLVQQSKKFEKGDIGEEKRLNLIVEQLLELKDEQNSKCQCTKAISHNKSGEPESTSCLLVFLKALLYNQGFQDIAQFLCSNSERLQMSALRAVWLEASARRVLDNCVTQVEGSKGHGTPFSQYMQLLSKRKPVSEKVISVLFEILTGNINSNNDSGSVKVMGAAIVEPDLLPELLHTLTKATTQAVNAALQHLLLLLKDVDARGRYDSASVFLDRRGWQKWVFPLLLEGSMAAEEEVPVRGPDGKELTALEQQAQQADLASDGAQIIGGDMENSLFKLTMALFTTVHYAGLLLPVEKGGGTSKVKDNVMYKTIQLLSNFSEGWSHEAASIARVMLMTILSKLTARARAFTGNFDYQRTERWNSIFCLLDLVEEFLFMRPIDGEGGARTKLISGIHWDRDGVPLDLMVVDRAMKLLEALHITKDASKEGQSAIPMAEGELEKMLAVHKKGADFFSFFGQVQALFVALQYNAMHAAEIKAQVSQAPAGSAPDSRKQVLDQFSKLLTSRQQQKPKLYSRRRITMMYADTGTMNTALSMIRLSAIQDSSSNSGGAVVAAAGMDLAVTSSQSGAANGKEYKVGGGGRAGDVRQARRAFRSLKLAQEFAMAQGLSPAGKRRRGHAKGQGDSTTPASTKAAKKTRTPGSGRVQHSAASRSKAMRRELAIEEKKKRKKTGDGGLNQSSGSPSGANVSSPQSVTDQESKTDSKLAPGSLSDRKLHRAADEHKDELDEKRHRRRKKQVEVLEYARARWQFMPPSVQGGQQPSTQPSKFVRLAKGDLVAVLSKAPNGWWLVSTQAGKAKGYVPGHCLEVLSRPTTAQTADAIHTASSASASSSSSALSSLAMAAAAASLTTLSNPPPVASAATAVVVSAPSDPSLISSTTSISGSPLPPPEDPLPAREAGLLHLPAGTHRRRKSINETPEDLLQQMDTSLPAAWTSTPPLPANSPGPGSDALPPLDSPLPLAHLSTEADMQVDVFGVPVEGRPLRAGQGQGVRDDDSFEERDQDSEWDSSASDWEGDEQESLVEQEEEDEDAQLDEDADLVGEAELECRHCGMPVSISGFYEEEGEFYCEEDYKQLFCRCKHCSGEIRSDFVAMSGQRFHLDCLRCSRCNANFSIDGAMDERSIFERNRQYFCTGCFEEVFGYQCDLCRGAIPKSQQVVAPAHLDLSPGHVHPDGGRLIFHPDCFTCSTCGKTLDSAEQSGVGGGFFRHGDALYCPEDYHAEFGTGCVLCGRAVTGEVVEVEALEGVCCFDCIKCHVCSLSLQQAPTSTFFFRPDGRVCCEKHQAELKLDKPVLVPESDGRFVDVQEQQPASLASTVPLRQEDVASPQQAPHGQAYGALANTNRHKQASAKSSTAGGA
eukprot:g70501.t1